MRKTWKILSSFLAIVIIVSSLSVLVSASSTDESFWRSMSNDYYYKQLTTNEKKFYDRLDEACMAYLLNDKDIPEDYIFINCTAFDLSLEQVDKVQVLFYLSNPQYFFLEPKYKYSENGVEFNVYPELRYGSKRAAAKAEVKACVETYIAEAKKYSLPEQQENAVAELICAKISRDLDQNPDKEYYQCVYSAVQGLTKCKGFAVFFSAVMNALGIECISANSEPHAWNYIKLHGYWYCVDITSMNQELHISYSYYNHDGKDLGNIKYSEVDSRIKRYLPATKYDGVGRKYTSRYFEEKSVTYFIVNDVEDNRLVIPVKGSTDSLPKTIEYDNYEYTVMNATGWTRSGTKWIYYDESGKLVKGWYEIENEGWYYFDKYGFMTTNWQQINGKWYYFGGDGIMKTGWLQISGKWYYFNADGDMATGWKQVDGIWYYFNTDGDMVTGWKLLSGKWYYFNAGGDMVTGWKAIGGVWYYFNAGGDMVTGWKAIGGVWYYFNVGGDMVTGWKQLSGKWYFFNGSGAMATGWKATGGQWYYFSKDGDMLEGWQKIGGDVYYLVPGSGYMATGSIEIDGETYLFASNGVCTNPLEGI